MLRFRSSLIALVVLVTTAGAACADDTNAPATPADAPPVVLEPTHENGTPVVRLPAPRPDGTGRVPGEMVEFQLTDQLGRTVTRETLLGHPWVANFIFSTCPSHCPATLREMYELQKRLKDTDVKLVTITVDPTTDTVARMLELSKAFGADPDRWLFLTGDPAQVHHVIADGFGQLMVANPMQLAHSLNLMHVDAEGRVVGQYRYHYQEPEGPDQLNLLRRVLKGEMESPEKNKYIMTHLQAAADQARQDRDAAAETPAAAPPAAASPVSEDDPIAKQAPAWVERLRTTNAMLNGLATLLLLAGFAAIKSGNIPRHKRLMLTAFAVSAVFLACYLTCHAGLQYYTDKGHKPYAGSPSLLVPYRIVLWSHIALAATVPVLAIITIRRGLKEQWDAHRRIARITFPIWLYVSVTGVVVYWMNA